ncbi:MAG: hypothetical protein HQM12_24100 [SAR324 cluster bacterium]|nr:hypothetical protein [SAR324 cluster bacterium]
MVDVSTPADPTQLAIYNPAGVGISTKSVYAMTLKNNYLYALFAGYDSSGTVQDGLYVIDYSNRTSPFLLGSFNTGSSYHYGIALEGNYAFIAAGSSNTGLYILDISNPANISQKGFLSHSSLYDVVLKDNYAIVAQDNGISIAEVTNKASPSLTSSLNTLGSIHSVAVAGNMVQAGSTYGLYYIDVSDMSNPLLVGHYHVPWTAEDVAIANNLSYVATLYNGNNSSGTYILSHSQPSYNAHILQASASSTLSYKINWDNTVNDVFSDCKVSGGSCVLSNHNRTVNSVDVSWTLPRVSGDYQMAVIVGDSHFFTSAWTKIRVQ